MTLLNQVQIAPKMFMKEVSIIVHQCRRNVVVFTAAQLHSTKPELRYWAGSNPPGDMPEIQDGEDL